MGKRINWEAVRLLEWFSKLRLSEEEESRLSDSEVDAVNEAVATAIRATEEVTSLFSEAKTREVMLGESRGIRSGAASILLEAGCNLMKKEDCEGELKSGWWKGNKFLAACECQALQALEMRTPEESLPAETVERFV